MLEPAYGSRSGKGRAHRLFHPLCGATPDVLLPLILDAALHRGIAPGRAHVLGVALLMAGIRLPFTLGEAVAASALDRWRPAGPPPVFIVGHWRSGTTHLANLLSRSPAFGILSPISVGLPAEALGLARVARPFMEQFFPHTRLIDDLALASDLPQEDELAMANLSLLSCNHGVYFPYRLTEAFDRGVFLDGVGERSLRRWGGRLRHYVRKMGWLAGGRPVLIRNPANSARIPLMRALWPDARFIHIHRHPAEVVTSSRRVFDTLLRELSLGAPVADTGALVRRVYPRLMETLDRDVAALPPGQFAEIRFEHLRRRPMEELGRVHRELSLPGFEDAAPFFERYLRTVEGHVPRARSDAVPPSETAWLRERCAPIFRRWGYALPEDGDLPEAA
ncbi:sulfotransferase family protein [Rhizosaccharibacter radicis]|uniref:Sulfotransferase n=1 Tax=Rhizosaccharibacter radicis TaxID=2782605 RepID=A0ABT1VYY4_9PROT|nr:sulfotransferase [Acetobacteraceae bacterium KSS12]